MSQSWLCCQWCWKMSKGFKFAWYRYYCRYLLCTTYIGNIYSVHYRYYVIYIYILTMATTCVPGCIHQLLVSPKLVFSCFSLFFSCHCSRLKNSPLACNCSELIQYNNEKLLTLCFNFLSVQFMNAVKPWHTMFYTLESEIITAHWKNMTLALLSSSST